MERRSLRVSNSALAAVPGCSLPPWNPLMKGKKYRKTACSVPTAVPGRKKAGHKIWRTYRKNVDRRAFIAMGVVAVLLIAALIIASGISSSMLENSKLLELRPEPENCYDPRQPSTSSPGEEDLAFYVEAGNSAELYVPVVEYYAYHASGYGWQGPEALFGEDMVYNMDAYILEFHTVEESAYGYDLELWDNPEDIPDMEPISPEDFPR